MRLVWGVVGLVAFGCWLGVSRVTVNAAAGKDRLAAGALLFHEKGCEYCHGAELAGTEKAPDLTAVGKRRNREYIARQIREGGGGMPAFGEVLVGDEAATLVDFLETKRKQGRVNAAAMAIPAAHP